MRKISSALCLFLLCSASAMQAQTPTATVSGIVKDSQGAVVQGAKVVVTNIAQDATRESATNSDGAYSIPDLLPGEYRAEVSSNGFATAPFAGIVLEAGRAFTLDATLAPANQVTTVNVTTATQTVDLTQSMLQGQITASTIGASRSTAGIFLNWLI